MLQRSIYFTVPGKPQGKERPKFARVGRRAIAYTPKKTRDYEQFIRDRYAECIAEPRPFFERKIPLKLEITAVFPIPLSWSQKKKTAAAMQNLYPVGKPDGDNIAKIIQDALNRTAYEDDAQIVESCVKKVYGKTPEARILIRELTETIESEGKT